MNRAGTLFTLLAILALMLCYSCGGSGNDALSADSGGGDQGSDMLEQEVWDIETQGIPQFISTNFLDLSYIRRISRFRSSIGHDYSDHFECQRSMKHYFEPLAEDDEFLWTDIPIYAPISGTVAEVVEEWAGTQIWIKSDQYPAFHVIIFHVGLNDDYQRGDVIEEGQLLGHHGSSNTWTDLAVAVWSPCPEAGRDCEPTGDDFDTCENYAVRNISAFEAMTDEVFAEYQAFETIATREDLIIDQETRDQYPGFSDYPEAASWVVLHDEEGGNDSAFTPATGADLTQSGDGPWNRRLRLATSSDGATWTRSDLTITDQGDVPALLVKDNTLWLFYVMWSDADNTAELRNTTVAATSTDLRNWTFRQLTFTGLPEGRTINPVDPAVVSTGGGGYRMYFTLGELTGDGYAQTYSAVSSDLLNWTVEGGPRYPAVDDNVLDPNLLWVGDHYEFFAGGKPGANYHGVSTGEGSQAFHGLAFLPLDDFAVDPFVVMANGLEIGDAYKYFGFIQEKDEAKAIRSLTYKGDRVWELDDGVVLEVDESGGGEAGYVADPAVALHPAGSNSGYVMVYVTQIPK